MDQGHCFFFFLAVEFVCTSCGIYLFCLSLQPRIKDSWSTRRYYHSLAIMQVVFVGPGHEPKCIRVRITTHTRLLPDHSFSSRLPGACCCSHVYTSHGLSCTMSMSNEWTIYLCLEHGFYGWTEIALTRPTRPVWLLPRPAGFMSPPRSFAAIHCISTVFGALCCPCLSCR